MRASLIALSLAVANGFSLTTPAASVNARSPAVSMKEYGVGYSKAKFVSDGAFGGKKKPGTPGKWIGDKSKGTQIANYEKGADFLFFQNPTPKTGFQEKEVNFFSAENFQQAELQGPLQLLVTATGLGSFAVLAAALIGDVGVSLPSAPKVSAPAISAPKFEMKKADPEAEAKKAAAAKEKAEAKAAKAEAVAAKAAAAKEAKAAEAKKSD